MDTREQKHFGVGGQWLAKLTILLRIATTLIGADGAQKDHRPDCRLLL